MGQEMSSESRSQLNASLINLISVGQQINDLLQSGAPTPTPNSMSVADGTRVNQQSDLENVLSNQQKQAVEEHPDMPENKDSGLEVNKPELNELKHEIKAEDENEDESNLEEESGDERDCEENEFIEENDEYETDRDNYEADQNEYETDQDECENYETDQDEYDAEQDQSDSESPEMIEEDQDMSYSEEGQQEDLSDIWLNDDGSVTTVTSEGLSGHITFNMAGPAVMGGKVVLSNEHDLYTGPSRKRSAGWMISNRIPLQNHATWISNTGTEITVETEQSNIIVTTDEEHPERVSVKVQGPYGEKRLCLMAQKGPGARFLPIDSDEESDEGEVAEAIPQRFDSARLIPEYPDSSAMQSVQGAPIHPELQFPAVQEESDTGNDETRDEVEVAQTSTNFMYI